MRPETARHYVTQYVPVLNSSKLRKPVPPRLYWPNLLKSVARLTPGSTPCAAGLGSDRRSRELAALDPA